MVSGVGDTNNVISISSISEFTDGMGGKQMIAQVIISLLHFTLVDSTTHCPLSTWES